LTDGGDEDAKNDVAEETELNPAAREARDQLHFAFCREKVQEPTMACDPGLANTVRGAFIARTVAHEFRY